VATEGRSECNERTTSSDGKISFIFSVFHCFLWLILYIPWSSVVKISRKNLTGKFFVLNYSMQKNTEIYTKKRGKE